MNTLQTRIFLALIAGVAIGLGISSLHLPYAAVVVDASALFGTAFIRLVTMVVVPLVVSSLVTGIASLGDLARLGRIGGRTLVYFAVTTFLAAAIGVAIARAVHLGEHASPPEASTMGSAATTPERPAAAATSLPQMLVELVPQNPIGSAAQGDLLPLIIASCIFGAAATAIGGEGRRILVSLLQAINDVSMVVLRWVMHLAPAAVLVLTAATVTRSGIDVLAVLFTYSLVVVLSLVAFVAVVLFPIVRFGAGMRVGQFVRSVSDALLLAFSTASSNVALPVSMAAAKDRLAIPNEIVGFVLPAGTTLNKNGSAVYKAVTAVFVAEYFGFHLGWFDIATIVLTSVLAATAGAGVPASSLVTTLIVLNAIGLGPRAAAGIALVAGIDRPLDMCRTTVNTIGNLVGAALIAANEREHSRRAGLVAADPVV